MLPAFQFGLAWKEYVETRIITEEGAYAKGQVPSSYGGAELEVEVLQRVIFCDEVGHLTQLEFNDISSLKDKDNKTGLSIKIIEIDGTETVTPASGPSDQQTTWTARYRLSTESDRHKRALTVYQLAKAQQAAEANV